MRIDITNTAASKRSPGDQAQYFVVMGHRQSGQALQGFKRSVSLLQVAQGQLAENEWVGTHLRLPQQRLQRCVAHAQVIHPYRRIYQHHGIS